MSKEKPDIVLLLPDQLRRDMCGCYGGSFVETPAIDRISNEGLTIDNAISPCPVCTPFRGMLMTGRYPTHSGILNNFVQSNPRQNPHALAVMMKKAGYETAYIGKWHLDRGEYGEPTDHPSFVPPGPERLGFDHWEAFNFHMDFQNYWYYRDAPEKIFDDRYETDAVFEQAIALLKARQSATRPVFLVVSPHPPHPPFRTEDVPKEYLETIPEEISWPANVPEDNPRETEAMRVYLAMVKNLDYNVGRFLDWLDDSATADSTCLIFTSDHGEMHGSHGRVNKMVPYAEALDVPLIFRWPGRIAAGRRSDLMFGPMDYLPTLCALVGQAAPPEADGEDLSEHLLSGTDRPDRDMLIMNYSSHWNYFRSETPETASDWRCWPEWRGVRSKRHTYVQWLSGEEELYDNSADPFQLENLIAEAGFEELASRYRKSLSQLLAEAHDEFLPGSAYAEWFDEYRRLRKTALGPVPSGA